MSEMGGESFTPEPTDQEDLWLQLINPALHMIGHPIGDRRSLEDEMMMDDSYSADIQFPTTCIDGGPAE